MPAFRRALVFFLFVVSASAQEPKLFDQVDEMLASLSKITGWQVHRKVPAQMIGADKFRQVLKSHVDKADPKKVHAEELTLQMFGLVPKDFSLVKETVDLFSEQVAAYYDSDKKRLFVLDTVATELDRRIALVHELAHALADQQHPLLKYLHVKTSTEPSPDDATTARQAVMEGQATWLTWAYVAARNGGKAEVPQSMLDLLTKATGGSTDLPVFANSPLYFRESLTFPYNQGLKFQDAIYRQLGQGAFEEVFLRAPASTQNILHPDTYIAKRVPVKVKLPPLKDLMGTEAGQFRALTEGDLGEFDVTILLRQYTSEKESDETAPHLSGASFMLYEHKQKKFPVLMHVTQWDDPPSARRYFELYQRVIEGKSKDTVVHSARPADVAGTTSEGKFELHLRGNAVQVLEGVR